MQIIFGTLAIILAFVCSCLSSVFNFLFPNPEILTIRENLDMNIKPYQIEFHEDTRGWFGDGEEIIIFRPNRKQIEKNRNGMEKNSRRFRNCPFNFSGKRV